MIAHLLLSGCLAMSAVWGVGALVLPSLAGDEMRSALAASIRGCGARLSAYAAVVIQ